MIFPLLLLLASADPQGWMAARWGMTEQQVLAAVPEAARLSTPIKYLRDGQPVTVTIGISSIRIADTNWQVGFLPTAGKLSEVRLQPVDPAELHEQTYDRVERLLVQKYGRPFERQENGGKRRTATWTAGATTITLTYTDLTPTIDMRSLWLIYRQAQATDTDKL